MKQWICWIAWVVMLCIWTPSVVFASDNQQGVQENDIYDSLKHSIRENWDHGLENLETKEEIEIKGPFSERILRSIANVFYQHLVSIKAWSLLIGLVSFVIGIFIAVTAKLNKKLRRFAITVLVVTVPVLLLIFTFGITKLISMFV